MTICVHPTCSFSLSFLKSMTDILNCSNVIMRFNPCFAKKCSVCLEASAVVNLATPALLAMVHCKTLLCSGTLQVENPKLKCSKQLHVRICRSANSWEQTFLLFK